MKNVKNVPNFYQRNNKAEINSFNGIIVLPSVVAWENYEWTHNYFVKKPEQGFFLWVKESIFSQINTLVEIDSKNVFQKMNNLIVIEKGIKAKLFSTCKSLKEVKGKHFAKAKIIIKKNSFLEFLQYSSWQKGDEFKSEYEFFLEEKAYLKANISNKNKGAKIVTKENVYLGKRKASADVRIKMVAEKGGTFFSESYIHGESNTKGHLECSGLISGKDSKITSIPGLMCNSDKAELTHEAFVGKISEGKLMYLRMRGLSLRKAEEIIINSFLSL